MATAMMTERSGMGMMGMPMTTPGAPMGTTAGMPATMNTVMVPRCVMKFEKCDGGMTITCVCDDKVTAGMLQNLCAMTAGGMCSCCMTLNGMTACCCNLTMGLCKCEATSDGVRITCTSGDAACCAMIQACCDCMCSMMEAGCSCCMMMNGMPICCGCC